MHSKSLYLLALTTGATLTSAFPQRFPLDRRVVDKLNEEATREAHQRDDTATRAFSSVTINTAGGKCLFVDPLSGDFRANLLPVQIKDCDGSDGQKWDIITAGKHNDQPGTMLVVSALTQGCLNYDPRRQPGDQVNIFSCGGRAAGEGTVTNSQLFSFTEVTAGPLSLQPLNEAGTCITSSSARLDKAACDNADQSQIFTFGDGAAGGNEPEDPVDEPAPAPTSTSTSTSTIPENNIPTFAPFPTDGFQTIPAPTITGPGGVGGGAPAPTEEPTPTDDGETGPDPTETGSPTETEAPTTTAPPAETETPSPTTGDDEVTQPTPTPTRGAGNGGNGGNVGGGNGRNGRNGRGRGGRGNGRGNNRGNGRQNGRTRAGARRPGRVANGRTGGPAAQECKDKKAAARS